MQFTPSTEQDIQQLTEWIEADPYHKDCLDPFWWLTGNGVLSFKIEDGSGTTLYVRLDEDNGLMRLHTQFAPESEVSKTRVVKTILWTIPKLQTMAENNGLAGFIYKSTSPLLIEFMKKKFGFSPVGTNDDYWMPFEVK